MDTQLICGCGAGFSVLTIRRSCSRWSAAANSAACTRFPRDGAHWVRASTYAELFVGAPVKLVAPEMQVARAAARAATGARSFHTACRGIRGRGAGVSETGCPGTDRPGLVLRELRRPAWAGR